jgi:hypothetical protein
MNTLFINEKRAARVVALQKKAIASGLKGTAIRRFIADNLNITEDSVRRYLHHIENKMDDVEVAEEPPADPVEVRRHKIKAEDAAKRLKELEERLVAAEDIRGELLSLGPLNISKLKPDLGRSSGRRAVIMHISDIQYGEYIDYDELDGVNSYDTDIANKRIARYFQKCHRFVTELWQGAKPEEIIILLNGDMISGALHHELDRTDRVRPMEASQMVAEQLIMGINLLLDEGFTIRVIGTPGNHGRTTIKPESKGHAAQNYDTLVCWFIEREYRKDDRITVEHGKVDALFSVFSFPMLVTHGDRIGSRGGQGFMGAAATILRGHTKLVADYAQRNVNLYKVFTGHFHTVAETPFGYANGTMAGWSEYARDGRMRCAPAMQDYFVVHEDHGVIEMRHISLGTADEGTSHDAKFSNGVAA